MLMQIPILHVIPHPLVTKIFVCADCDIYIILCLLISYLLYLNLLTDVWCYDNDIKPVTTSSLLNRNNDRYFIFALTELLFESLSCHSKRPEKFPNLFEKIYGVLAMVQKYKV